MNFNITPAAAQRIAHLIQESLNKTADPIMAKEKNIKNPPKQILALRISVDGGGCSGFMYQYNLTDTINEDDFVCSHNDIKVVIDELSQQFLNDCTVEFIEELGNNYFQISNPNATAKCGCGNSFAT